MTDDPIAAGEATDNTRYRPGIVADAVTGEKISDVCLGCVDKMKKLDQAWRRNDSLSKELADERGEEGVAADVREVLEYWRGLCMPGAKLVVRSERWEKVRKLLSAKDVSTKKPAYTVLALKAAVVGAKLDPFLTGEDPRKRAENGGKVVKHLDAVTIFRDPATVDRHINRLRDFRAERGVSALNIVDALFDERLRFLADLCSCGYARVDHLRGVAVRRVDNGPPVVCREFDEQNAAVERTLAVAS